FLGQPRDRHLYDHAHEAPWTMWVPQMILAGFAIVIGWEFFGVGEAIARTAHGFEQGFGHDALHAGYEFVHGSLLNGIGWMISVGLAFAIYINGLAIASKVASVPGVKQIHWWLYNKMGF